MKNLESYFGKNVIVKDIDGIVYRGFIDTYTTAADNDDTEESIGIMPSRTAKNGVELMASEVISIEEIR